MKRYHLYLEPDFSQPGNCAVWEHVYDGDSSVAESKAVVYRGRPRECEAFAKQRIESYLSSAEYKAPPNNEPKTTTVRQLQVGDKVWMDGATSMAQQSAGNVTITKVDHRFDPITGEKFPVYYTQGQWWDGRTGSSYPDGKSMYYLDLDQPE